MKLVINEKEYNIRFGYKALAKSGILEEVANIADKMDSKEGAEIYAVLSDLFETLAKMVLAGLQKNHKDEFGVDYDDEDSVNKMLDVVYDMLDEYMDTDDSEDIMALFNDLSMELMDNGFLSKKSEKQKKSLTKLNATTVPQDHRKKTN